MTYEQADAARRFLEARLPAPPAAGVVLGSGLGAFAGELCDRVEIPYGEIPHWPQSSVPGHSGTLVFGRVGGAPVVVLSGRVHLYEGRSPAEVVFPARVLGLLGIRTLILTNACGGINPQFHGGQLVLIRDHINLLNVNPLSGVHDDRFGPRFVDLSGVYPARLRQLACDCARRLGLDLPEGVYAAFSGPTYETPAEIGYLRAIGADLIGMSTVPEAVAAAQMGIPVLGFSCIANMAAGMSAEKTTHEAVLAAVSRVSATLAALLTELIPLL